MKKVLKQLEDTLDVIRKLKDVHKSLLKEPISEGKWSIREIIGHLYYWDKYNLEKMVPEMTNGANLPEFPDHDQYNEEAISYLRDSSVEAILDAFLETREELIKSISKVGEDVRFTIGNGKRQFSSESFVKIFVKHDIHHLQQIKEKLKN
ncbi:DinB family protein [Ornithinibacillus scapharcae]|uniref:DinB family protein n=1 Tax=Ornithinibacillus scapharcae TaxID=1147159 RepID=UPI000225B2FA|nr:DinB family protein [Ornithinibacillus scapharcae]